MTSPSESSYSLGTAKLFHSRKIIAAALLLWRPVGQRADGRRMRKLQINERVFVVELDLDYESGADIVYNPIGSGQRFSRAIRGIPENFPGFALDLRGIELKNLTIVTFD